MSRYEILSPEQINSVRAMKNGCILCGGTGSGKSRTAIGYYYILNGGSYGYLSGDSVYKRMVQPRNLYIITTARKRDTLEWENELIPYLMSIHPESNKYNNLADLYCTHSATCLNIPEDENYKLSIQKIR